MAKEPDKSRPKGRSPETTAPVGKIPFTFIEQPSFSRRWLKLGLNDHDLTELQLAISSDPKAGDVVTGTHSLRKMRYAPQRWPRGKSGATRVLYVYFETFGLVLLCTIYEKSEAANISAAGKAALNRLIDEVESELRKRRAAWLRRSEKPHGET